MKIMALNKKARFAICIISLLLVSCAPNRAVIDNTASEKIFWPGPPEKPRIAFLRSIASEQAAADAGGDISRDRRIDMARLLLPPSIQRPYSIFPYEKGLLYITDTGSRCIFVIDTATAEISSLSDGNGIDFESPVGVAAYRNRIYVTDSSLKKVFILGMDGKKVGEFGGSFARPTALAVDKTRAIIYVSDTVANKIYKYDLEGERIGSIGDKGSGEAEFNLPTHLWVDKDGRLYVTDSMNSRVQVFSPEGKFQRMFGRLGDAYGELDKPKGVATDSDGNIYVVDSIKDTVKIYDTEGKLLLFFGTQGRDFGQFYLPSGIFIDEKDQIYVADTYNARVQVFKYLRAK